MKMSSLYKYVLAIVLFALVVSMTGCSGSETFGWK